MTIESETKIIYRLDTHVPFDTRDIKIEEILVIDEWCDKKKEIKRNKGIKDISSSYT